jgi:hypothetical protein
MLPYLSAGMHELRLTPGDIAVKYKDWSRDASAQSLLEQAVEAADVKLESQIRCCFAIQDIAKAIAEAVMWTPSDTALVPPKADLLAFRQAVKLFKERSQHLFGCR